MISDFTEANGKFLQHLYEATENQEKWKSALGCLAESCGAQAAIITLRSRKNAEVVISSEMAFEFHTPFIAGLPTDAVEFYISQLREKDIWAHAQAKHHPYQPTIMSNFVSEADLMKSDFGKWANTLDVNDTIVTEIGHSKNYWTALNVFFRRKTPTHAEQMRQAIQVAVPHIRHAWRISRQHQQLIGAVEQIGMVVEAHPTAMFMLDADGRIVAQSNEAIKLQNDGLIQLCPKHRQIEVPQNMELATEVELAGLKIGNAKVGAERYSVRTHHSEQLFLSIGETLGMYIVSFEADTDTSSWPWEHSSLTEREKAVVWHIAKSGRVKSAQELLGLKERQTRNVWKTAQTKLGGLSRNELTEHYRQFIELKSSTDALE